MVEMGRTNLILDNLIAEGKVKPFIVVMETSAVGPQFPMGPRAGALGTGAPRPGVTVAGAPAAGTPGATPRPRFSFDKYAELMINDMIPWVDNNFRTIASAHRYVRTIDGCYVQVGHTSISISLHISVSSAVAPRPHRYYHKSVNCIYELWQP
jgi:hypothetical protein